MTDDGANSLTIAYNYLNLPRKTSGKVAPAQGETGIVNTVILGSGFVSWSHFGGFQCIYFEIVSEPRGIITLQR